MSTSTQAGRLLVALLVPLIAPLAASAGTVALGTFAGSKAGFYDVSESGATIPPSLFTPAAPVYSESPNPQLRFLPTDFTNLVVETTGTAPFDLQYKSAQLTLPMAAQSGYAFTGTSLQLAGSYSLFAPFANSQAKVTMTGQYTVQVTEVDQQAWAGTSPYSSSLVITSDNVTSVANDSASGNWAGTAVLDWNALKVASGVGLSQKITGATIQFTTQIAAASVYASAEATVTNFTVNAPVEAVPVPEPPTIILAGLGAAAVVANVYRRRKLRSQKEDASSAEEMSGAIALTA
jgi:hypothetical protein